MSHVSETDSSSAPGRDGSAAEFPTHPSKRSTMGLRHSDGEYIPISQRTSDQLLANAAELRHMARTATTADVVKALTTLADRYTSLAIKRRADEDAGNAQT